MKQESQKKTELHNDSCLEEMKDLPKKEVDPRVVVLHVSIGNTEIGNALIDLVAIVNIIPLTSLSTSATPFMAEATRLQNAIREAEERIMGTVEPCITRQIRELENRFETQFTNVQEAMCGTGLHMSELTAARRHGGAGDGAT
ncbi:hypothetical protein KIW84_035006 [Lathyrus oleraceus]|uniref:Uncharacterized protein n=1 Tax=Pisum sativum TaxID=3888 RepID=A0A9D5B047_PEA|nr:hypothetical protein KIW84_035006 [Pisum sativum]